MKGFGRNESRIVPVRKEGNVFTPEFQKKSKVSQKSETTIKQDEAHVLTSMLRALNSISRGIHVDASTSVKPTAKANDIFFELVTNVFNQMTSDDLDAAAESGVGVRLHQTHEGFTVQIGYWRDAGWENEDVALLLSTDLHTVRSLKQRIQLAAKKKN